MYEKSNYENHVQRDMTQLNLRVSRQTADSFRVYCKTQGLTQNQALATLLSQTVHDGYESAEESLSSEVKRYKEMADDYKAKYDNLCCTQERKEQTAWRRCRDWAKVVKEMLTFVAEFRDRPEQSPMKVGRVKKYPEKKTFQQYQYPKGAGCIVVRLDSLMYSNSRHPALFVLVHSGNNLLKFRWYPDERFLGIPPRSTGYAYPDALWLFGYMPSTDGATQLIAAIPLESIHPTKKIDAALCNMHEISNLDMVIADAERRKK